MPSGYSRKCGEIIFKSVKKKICNAECQWLKKCFIDSTSREHLQKWVNAVFKSKFKSMFVKVGGLTLI